MTLDLIEQLFTLMAAASSAPTVEARAVYLAQARAQIERLRTRLANASTSLDAMERELGRSTKEGVHHG